MAPRPGLVTGRMNRHVRLYIARFAPPVKP